MRGKEEKKVVRVGVWGWFTCPIALSLLFVVNKKLKLRCFELTTEGEGQTLRGK